MKLLLAMVMVMALVTASGAQQTSPGAQPSASHSASSDHTFAMKAGQANFAEVELGKLALQKSMNDDVKKFAQMMIDDHGKALDELKSIASKQDITLPSELDADHKALSDQLSKLSGAAFDRAYIEAMVDGHKKVAAEVRKESQSGSDPELKAWAAKVLPTVEGHLERAETINKGLHSGSTTQ